MKQLPEVDIRKLYHEGFSSFGVLGYDESIKKLTEMIAKENCPARFRNQLFAIMQLYTDGLISSEDGKWSEQKETLDNLILSGKNFVGQFYRGSEVDLDGIRRTLSPYLPIIKKHASKKIAKTRYLASEDSAILIQKFGSYLTEGLGSKPPFETLVCILSGGLEPTCLAADVLEVDLEDLVFLRYSNRSRKEDCVKLPKSAPEDYISSKVEGKSVLIIDDVHCAGDTMNKVADYLIKINPSRMGAAVVNRIFFWTYDSVGPSEFVFK